MTRTKTLAVAGATGLALTAALAPPATAGGSGDGFAVVARGIDNPRGMALAPDGSIYVAAAGAGGRRCIGSGEQQQCAGRTGRILRLRNGRVSPFGPRLVSASGPGGIFAGGPSDVTVDPRGRVWTVTNLGGTAPPRGLPAGLRNELGRVIQVRRNSLGLGPRLYPFENRVNPIANRDSNPYSIVATRDARFVADAGGNDLLRVGERRVSLVSVFPDIRRNQQSVPTQVRIGPDGAFYVAELGGGASGAGASRVWRVTRDGRRRVFARGLTKITGIAFGPDRSLYVSELSRTGSEENPAGQVVRIRPNGRRSFLGRGKLFFPAGVAVNERGTVYVSNWSVAPGKAAGFGPTGRNTGQIVRFGPR